MLSYVKLQNCISYRLQNAGQNKAIRLKTSASTKIQNVIYLLTGNTLNVVETSFELF